MQWSAVINPFCVLEQIGSASTMLPFPVPVSAAYRSTEIGRAGKMDFICSLSKDS
jgi:hypothetical protein